MAGRIEVAQGYITILPSLKGVQQKIAKELTPAATDAGKKAGKAIEDGVSKGAETGAKEAASKVKAEVPKGAEQAGKEAGDKLSKGLRSSSGDAAAEVSKNVQRRLNDGLKGIGDRFRSIGDGVRGIFSGIGTTYSAAFADMGKVASNWGITKAFQSLGGTIGDIGTKASGMAATVRGTFSGVAAFVGDAFRGVSTKVGSVFQRVGTVAGEAFSIIGKVFAPIGSVIGSAFGSLPGIAKGAFDGFAEIASKAFGGIVTGAKTAAAAAAAAIGAMTVQSVQAYSSYEQLSGGAKKIFDGMDYSTILSDAQGAYMTLNMSANEYLESINRTGAAFAQTMGAQEGYDTAKRGMQAISDFATGTGQSISELNDKYALITRSTSSYQTIADQFAGVLPQTSKDFLEQAQAAGYLSDSYESLTDVPVAEYQQAVTAMLEQGVDKLHLTGNTAVEAADSVEGSMLAMRAAWKNWLTSLASDDFDTSTMTTRLAESFESFAGNVIPVLSTAVSSVISEIPALVSTVGPQLGEALVSIVDSATGGLATKALDFVSPVTDALMGAFEGLGTWVSEHGEGLSALGDSLGGIGSQLVESLGGAIPVVADMLSGFASGALPIVTGALDFLSGLLAGVSDLFGNLATAVSPVTDALAPLAEMLATTVGDALSSLGEILASADFSEFGTIVSDLFQGVVDAVTGAFDAVVGFAQGVGEFLSDPIGFIQDALSNMTTSTDTVAASFEGTASSVDASCMSMGSSVRSVNSQTLEGKSAYFAATGNVIDGTASGSVSDMRSGVSAMNGKTVTVSANGNVAGGTVQSNIWDAASAIGSLYSKTVDVVTNFVTNGSRNASGAVIPRHADGFIATQPTLTDVGWIGEAGAEAVYSNGSSTGIFPLTNRKFTGPFASEIAEQVEANFSGGASYSVTVQASGDPDAIARAVTRELRAFELAHGRR